MLTPRSPFRFLDLPAEIRNMIYTYLAASYQTPETSKTKFIFRIYDLPHDTRISTTENHNAIMQPGLVRTCSQIYWESRLIFYRHHHFKLHIWQEEHKDMRNRLKAWFFSQSCLKRVMKWLDAIGVEARMQIRSLEIDVHDSNAYWTSTGTEFKSFISDLHARLSDEATVVYRPSPRCHNARILWELGKVFYDKDPTHVPKFEHPHWIVDGWNGSVWAFPSYLFVPVSTKYRVARPSLTFESGLGFFGGYIQGSGGMPGQWD